MLLFPRHPTSRGSKINSHKEAMVYGKGQKTGQGGSWGTLPLATRTMMVMPLISGTATERITNDPTAGPQVNAL